MGTQTSKKLHTTTVATTKKANGGITITAADAEAWRLVESVMSQLNAKDCTTITEACNRSGVPRMSFYNYMHRPYVQGCLQARDRERIQVTREVLERSWAPILINLVDIASGKGSDRDAVAAAGLVVKLDEKLQESAREGENPVAKSALALLESFLGHKTVTLRREIQEILVDFPETPDDPFQVIDVTPG